MEGISIIIPLYNKEKAIGNTLESVLFQSFGNYEIIVVDDGSTDNSRDVVLSYSDDRIKYYCKSNGGVSSARNYGMQKAQCDWIVFLDADDILKEDALNLFFKMHQEKPDYKVFVGNVLNDQQGVQMLRCKKNKDFVSVSHNPYKEMYLDKIAPRTGAYMLRKDIALSVPAFDERLSFFEDFGYISHVMDKCEFVYTSEPVVVYKIDNACLSTPNHPREKELPYYLDKSRVAGNYWREMVFSDILRYTEYVRSLANDKEGVDYYKIKYSQCFSLSCKLSNELIDIRKRFHNFIKRMKS